MVDICVMCGNLIEDEDLSSDAEMYTLELSKQGIKHQLEDQLCAPCSQKMDHQRTKKSSLGLCSFWGCKSKAVIAMVSRDLEKRPYNILCGYHWTCPGPMDTPSYADFHKNGTAHFDVEVIATNDA